MNSVRNGWVPALLLGALLLATAASARAQAERPLPRRMVPGPRARPEEVRRAVQERAGDRKGRSCRKIDPRAPS